MDMSCGEKILKGKSKSEDGRTVTMGRIAIVTRNHNGRQACHSLRPLRTRLHHVFLLFEPFHHACRGGENGQPVGDHDAVASHVTTDKSTGRASGVAYIDRESRAPRELRAKVVVLCASTIESTRLLLNSAPGGLANSSGVLGHYLMDHIYRGGASGELRDLPAKPWIGPPARPNGIYIPVFATLTVR